MKNSALLPIACLAFLVFLVQGCTSYHPLPLADNPDLIPDIGQVTESVPPNTVILADGLDMTETAVIAVSLNPDLRAVRMKRNVAQAEAFAAGLLPDPQLSGSVDHPTGNLPGLVNGYSGGLSFDLRSLLTHTSEKAAAEDKAKGVDLDILWQEWQVIQQARSLFVEKHYNAEKLKLLKEITALDRDYQDNSEKSMKAGDITLDQASANLTALMDAESQLRDAQRNALQTEHDLDALLGLAPGVAIRLSPLRLPELPSDKKVTAALTTLPERRPDLAALQAAYKSQEESLYATVLKQFPSISVGFNRARDTSNVHTAGLGVTIDLPIFNGSRGEISVQSATREQLHAEYQARLDQANAEVAKLWQQTRMIHQQIRELQGQLLKLEKMVAEASEPYKSGDFPALSYNTLRGSLLSKKMEYLDLQQSLWTNRIGLDTLLAWPLLKQEKPRD